MSTETMQRITGIDDIAPGVWVRTDDGELGVVCQYEKFRDDAAWATIALVPKADGEAVYYRALYSDHGTN